MQPSASDTIDHAPDVDEYLKERPGYLLRYGTPIALVLMLILLLIGLTTTYPATVEGTFTLSPPAGITQLSATNPLIVQRVLVADNQMVEAGQTLLVGRDSRLRYDQVFYLEDQLLNAAALPTERLAQLPMPNSLELGPLQEQLQAFMKQQEQYLKDTPQGAGPQDAAQLNDDARQSDNRLLATFHDLQQAVADWKQAFTIVSPVAGRIVLSDSIQQGQLVEQGQAVATVRSDSERRLRGSLEVPLQQSGRLSIGQSVLLDVTDWPALQYGVLKGEIVSVDPVPDGEWVAGEFVLSVPGLVTDMGKRIGSGGVLTGRVRIVVGESRLMDKIW